MLSWFTSSKKPAPTATTTNKQQQEDDIKLPSHITQKYLAAPPTDESKNFWKIYSSFFPGSFTECQLPYNVNLVDTPAAKATAPSMFGGYFDSPSSFEEDAAADLALAQQDVRIFLLYIPKSLKKHSSGAPLIFLLHGTDETCYDSEIFKQHDGKHAWFDVAEKYGAVLVLGQSRGLKLTYTLTNKPVEHEYRYAWQPSSHDKLYLNAVFDHVDKVCGSVIDKKRVYFVGFSNGGLFTSDLALLYVDKFSVRHAKYCIAAVCNFMGGVVFGAEEEYGPVDLTFKVPTKIVTGSRDDNCPRCLHAQQYFTNLGFPIVEYECIEEQDHKYLSTKTEEVFLFLIKHTSPY